MRWVIIGKWKINVNSGLKWKNNARDTNFFTKNFTKCWCSEWLLVNEKMMLMVGLDENQ